VTVKLTRIFAIMENVPSSILPLILRLGDCDPFVGIPVVLDLGVFSSEDPVAIARTCIDMVNNSQK